MERKLSEKQVRSLHEEFVSFRKYIDKLNFYDTHFGVIPFLFPDFDPDISKFFGPENLQILEDIWQKERQASSLLKRDFTFAESRYVFEVNFPNSNRAALNDFIIEKFVNDGRRKFDISVKKIKRKYSTLAGLSQYLSSLEGTIAYLQQNAKTTTDRSSKTRFVNVYITGLSDSYASKNIQVFSSTKKFLELYLYSQGKLFAYYVNALKDVLVSMDNPHLQTSESSKSELSKQRIFLLQQLRIVDAIELQFPNFSAKEKALKIAEIISFLISEPDTNFILRQLRSTGLKNHKG